MSKDIFETKTYEADFCVVGGGLSGMLAAIAAARHGSKVVLVQDRPVVGGNASSEIRMWPLGCHGENNRETGILEEIMLENMYRNPRRNFSLWDSVLYEKVVSEKNITLLLNTSVFDAEVQNNTIISVTGWQLTTYTFHKVYAKVFSDCSGDSVLAPLTGAKHTRGREAASEFNEDIEPDTADNKTMGYSCMIQARKTNKSVEFIPPKWAKKLTDEDLVHRGHDMNDVLNNFWWLELGGNPTTFSNAEEARHELLRIAFGAWDHVKNRGDHHADQWELEWVGFLPGKRESLRYIGAHILTQNDIRAEGRFEDIVAYGGWTMDDHHPDGFYHKGEPTVYHPAPAPYGIPYRCLYSVNISNLCFAGRNISVTHAALSSTRVMSTCAILGQAVGTAAAICIEQNCLPGEIFENKELLDELQQTLLKDDCYLPWMPRKINEITASATFVSSGSDTKALISGFDRPVAASEHVWESKSPGTITISLPTPARIKGLRFVFDSDLNRKTVSGGIQGLEKHPTLNKYENDMDPFTFPSTMVRDFEIGISDGKGYSIVKKVSDNYQRLVQVELEDEIIAQEVTIRFLSTWGGETIRVFAVDVY